MGSLNRNSFDNKVILNIKATKVSVSHKFSEGKCWKDIVYHWAPMWMSVRL